MARFSFSAIVFLLCVASSCAAQVVDVHTICKKTSNPSFCLSILNSSSNKDLVNLEQYTIGVVRTKVTGTITLINTLIARSGSNPKATQHYKSCLLHFGNEGALGEVASVQQSFMKKDYFGVNTHATALMTQASNCESASDPSFHDPSMLPKYAQVVAQVAEIILTISNFLIHN